MAFSEFPKLHSLVLDLHFDPRQIPVKLVKETEEYVLQEAFLNAATDDETSSANLGPHIIRQWNRSVLSEQTPPGSFWAYAFSGW